jgi:hypothetical protein
VQSWVDVNLISNKIYPFGVDEEYT